MKVHLNLAGPLGGLRYHLLAEGSVISRKDEAEVSIPDLVLLPESLIETTEVQVTPSQSEQYFITRWFDGEQFLPQAFCGIPLPTLMNDNLGPRVTTGCGGGYVDVQHSSRYFESKPLLVLLQDAKFRGTISIAFSGQYPTAVYQGVPCYGLYAILEGRDERIETLYSDPFLLRESFTVALHISRPPFPIVRNVEPLQVSGLSPSVLKHCYLHDYREFRGNFTSLSTNVATVTAWSTKSWRDCARRALYTASQIEFPEKQHRTDIVEYIQDRWNMLSVKQLIKSTV